MSDENILPTAIRLLTACVAVPATVVLSRSGPVRPGPASGIGLVLELAPPEPDDIVLDLHPRASMHSGVHVAAFLTSIRSRNRSPARSRFAIRRGAPHQADVLSLWLTQA
jgi:hypothetical protein